MFKPQNNKTSVTNNVLSPIHTNWQYFTNSGCKNIGSYKR